PAWTDGIADVLGLTREAWATLADDRRTQTVTRKQLDDELDTLEAALQSSPGETPAGIAGRLAALAIHADTVSDIARTLTEERGDDANADVLVWAAAVRASVQSHARDLEQLMPWARLLFRDAALITTAGADGHALLD